MHSGRIESEYFAEEEDRRAGHEHTETKLASPER